MELDFSWMEKISGRSADQTGQAADVSTDQPQPAADQTAEMENRAYSLLDAEAQERENNRQMYAAYQRAIRQAQTLTADIMHGMAAGREPTALLLQAVQCISLMTGDRALYDTAADTIRTVYGYGLRDAGALSGELQAAQDRLARLERAQQSNNLPPDGRQRLQAAIRAHRADVERLKLQLAG